MSGIPFLQTAGDAPGMEMMQWMAEQVPGGFFVYRADERQELLLVNRAAIRIFGCATPEEFRALTGNTFRGLVHPEDYARVEAEIAAQIGESEDARLDHVKYRILRRDGAVRWVKDYGRFAELPGYGPVYFVFLWDSTEEEAAQAELVRQTKIYQGMMHQFNAMAAESLAGFRADLNTGRILDARGSDLFATDYPGADMRACIEARRDSFLLEADRARFMREFSATRLVERYNRGEGPAVIVGYCRRRSGRECFVRFTGSVAVDPVSGEAACFGTETDYNAERVAEVLQSKILASQYDMVTYLVGDSYGVVIGGADTQRRGSIFPNRRSGSYSAYLREQVIPAASRGVHSAEALERALSPETVERELAVREPYTVDVTCDIDGETYNKRFMFYTVDRDAKFYILLKSDMTDVLRAEHARNDLLRDALRDARRASEAKTVFLSNMSHEIRTPLNAILGYDTLALRSPALPLQVREQLEMIGGSARHLLALVSDILDMSRIESGRLLLTEAPFSLRALLDDLCEKTAAQCAQKGLRFERNAGGVCCDVLEGDEARLRQVLENILSNAVKFTDAPGSVALTAEETARFRGRSTLRFSVRDTGVGIDPDFLPHIFDAFSQEAAGQSNKLGSTGLGMTITKRIVDAMNGDLTVDSEKGRGTQFDVTVTLRCLDGAPDAAQEAPRAALEGRRVLLAEDMEVNAVIMTDLLELRDMEVERGENGRVTAELFRESPVGYYDAVLMDIRMPEMDGYAATRAIRAMDRPDAKTVPIIAVSANALDEDVRSALQAGMNAHLAKPVDCDLLYDTLERFIGAREEARA